MDLHFTADEPTPEEREAVDGCLTALPVSTEPSDLRQYLLPVLHAVQGRVGWISPGAMNHLCRRLDVPPAEAFGVADFYALFQTRPYPPVTVHVCDDIGCRFYGGEALCGEMERTLGPQGASPDGRTTWHRSPCLGLCERAPAALVIAAGKPSREEALAPATVEAIATAVAGDPVPPMDLARSVPQLGEPGLTLLSRVGKVDPTSLDDYRAAGGFLALRRAFEMGAERVVREVIDAKLVGRGGAAFPTGQKWLGARSAPLPRYLICNADESEPGTFKDRVLMEGDPYALVEAMTIAGFATGCERGYLYIRGEYPLATERLAHAIQVCRERGYLGEDILGDGVRFDIELRRGAGAYICGEETALMNSLEGRRGEPRNKPPFPTQVGLFGQPTVINNVETMVNVLPIVTYGGKAYAAVGTERSTGPKLFCVSGHVARPGVYEVPFGVTLRQLLDLAGGPSGSGRWQAVLLGGAAGAFVTPDQLDVPLTFEGTRAIGATLGSGVVMPFDDTVDLRQVLRRIAQFFRDESCGQCVPCRVGAVRQEEVLARLAADRPLGSVEQELALLKELGQVMRDASICGLGQTASSAIESALARFPVYP
ncbi:MAG TPA: NAD(P)H-dependent oxidoreductase subunit E [Thermoanaerobaculia bacterium]|nr:NAD(P)H-dependent oxidoreductase subunit E [Thermoanaerobaculia bacterium]